MRARIASHQRAGSAGSTGSVGSSGSPQLAQAQQGWPVGVNGIAGGMQVVSIHCCNMQSAAALVGAAAMQGLQCREPSSPGRTFHFESCLVKLSQANPLYSASPPPRPPGARHSAGPPPPQPNFNGTFADGVPNSPALRPPAISPMQRGPPPQAQGGPSSTQMYAAPDSPAGSAVSSTSTASVTSPQASMHENTRLSTWRLSIVVFCFCSRQYELCRLVLHSNGAAIWDLCAGHKWPSLVCMARLIVFLIQIACSRWY